MAAPGPKSDKIWADAVRRAVLRRLENEEGKPQKIERLADNLVEWALEGKMDAVIEIANRLDGRPHQSVGGPNGEPFQIILHADAKRV
jgi:hypothetical protein